MKKPSTQTMVMGHPVIAVPMTLVSGVSLLAGFHAGSVFLVLFAIAMIVKLRAASEQAGAYRAWKYDWDGMDENPPRRAGIAGRVFRVMVIAALILVGVAMSHQLAYIAGYAFGWVWTHPAALVLPALLTLAVIVQFVRYFPRRSREAAPVAIVAKPTLPVPTLDAAYAALPDYCRQVLRR